MLLTVYVTISVTLLEFHASDVHGDDRFNTGKEGVGEHGSSKTVSVDCDWHCGRTDQFDGDPGRVPRASLRG